MYLKKLEIIGFKSFLNKTTLNFEPGMTAVVGPNGCGKSNIFDSIRWVLGEQSVKSLRGTQMEDVIFNGTDTKEPLSMAEVSLTFDNNNRFFPVEHDELIITRRIFRNGESEYLLNKAQVRLKDILELLMGTGIGAESYSLIEQGKIGLILSVKPEERRLVFDEASGITKYKTQKREALRKLEETEQNLLRVNDIVTEVKRQIGSLERQANKARRYKEVFEELKSKELQLGWLRKKALEAENGEILSKIEKCSQEEAAIIDEIKKKELTINSTNSEIKDVEGKLISIKNSILNLDNLISRNSERIKFNKERIAELETSKNYLNTQLGSTRNRLFMDEEKLNNIKSEYGMIKNSIEKSIALLKENEELLDEVGSSIKSCLNNISDSKRKILGFTQQISRQRNEIAEKTNKQQISLARKRRLDLEKAKAGEEKHSIENNLNSLTLELEKLSAELDNLNSLVISLKGQSEQEVVAVDNLNLEIDNMEKEKLTLNSQREFLGKLEDKYEHISESMDALIYLDKLPRAEISGLVIKIKNNSSLNEEEKRIVSNYVFKLSGQAKPLDLDTRNIDQKIFDLTVKIEALRAEKTDRGKKIKRLNEDILLKQELLRKQEIALANKKTFHQNIREQFERVSSEEEVILIELEEVEDQITQVQLDITELEDALKKLEIEHSKEEAAISQEQENINIFSARREKILVEIAQTKTQIEAQNKRLASDEATLKILEDTYNQDKQAVADLENQINEALSRQEALNLEIEGLNENNRLSQAEIDNKKVELEKSEEKYGLISKDVVQASKNLEEKRKELDGVRNNLYELHMQNKDIEFKILGVKDRMQQAYKADLDALGDYAGGEVDQNSLSAEIQKLKDKVDSYGSVNLVAIEEYDELKKRYDFLTQQQDDLLKAKEAVHEAILKINRTTKKMFVETFEMIKQEFRNYFRMLFNGGDAQIFLINEQDPLESGIEIICRPPGKKLQNVLLLSGGEKSMAAIALIFAIFKVKPSPFCVLDEIDAALDEANVDRFGSMLQDFTKASQFIVITHNKKTIANADVMYGITMEQSGISKIVSVKFGQNKAATVDRELVSEVEAESA
ncbi:MAG: hypothetical protein DRP74_06495 [Candidatus Omnitrophota bacterium]|nr:MAG: hypothetical protein DRP74_06495 [Candidatus Omnitrophota bacterium]